MENWVKASCIDILEGRNVNTSNIPYTSHNSDYMNSVYYELIKTYKEQSVSESLSKIKQIIVQHSLKY